jgi:hypothetical protein
VESAIAVRKPLPGLVHHSDRGIQYASGEYAAILRRHGMIPGMSRAGKPLRQRQLRKLHQDVEAGRDLRQSVSEPRSSAEQHRRVHRALLQQEALALGLGLSLTGRVRARCAARKRATTDGATVRFFPPSEEKASTLLAGEGTQSPSLLQTPSLLRINEMGQEENKC